MARLLLHVGGRDMSEYYNKSNIFPKLKIVNIVRIFCLTGGGNQMMNMNQNPGPVNATTCK